MKEVEILVIGKHTEIMATIIRLINNKSELNAKSAFSAAEAKEKSHTIAFNIVLLGAGLSDDENKQIKDYFNIPVIQHYGGGSGLLYAEIYQALEIKTI